MKISTKCSIIALVGVFLFIKAESYHQSFYNHTDIDPKDLYSKINGLGQKKVYDDLNYLHSDPEVYMNVSQIIRYRGYPVEEYTVPTKDGYLLGLQRIPHGLRYKEKNQQSRPAVFLQHGLLGSSVDWVVNLKNESLAFILADAGFDVWLGNMRGNVYSRKHKKLNPYMAEFWKFSWDEHANLDLPAMVDFTLNTTGAKNLYYVGHSQGTLIAFARQSVSADFKNKVKMFFAMGPVITAKNIIGLVKYLAYITPEIREIFSLFGVHEFLPNDEIFRILGETFCNYRTKVLCTKLIFQIAGGDIQNFNESRLPIYVSHDPAGTSVQNMVHFCQLVRTGRFQMYDYGSPELNKKHYNGKSEPPLYDAKKADIPTVLFSAGQDWLADPKDVRFLVSQLPNIVHHYTIPEWNHLDFIWGLDARKLVYEKVITYIKKAEKLRI